MSSFGVLLLVPFAAVLAAQEPGAVQGVVTNSVTGAPVRKALVTVRQVDTYSGYQAISGPDGQFRIEGIKPAEYVAFAEAQGYARDIPDLARIAPRAMSLTVAAGKTTKDVAVKLLPAAVVAGRVLDENGEPVRNANVRLYRYRYSPDGAHMASDYTATADDHGEFRIAGVAPGRWYAAVTRYVAPPAMTGTIHSSVPERGYAFTFHPGVERSAEAAAIDLAPGAEFTGLDLRLKKIRVFHIRGRITDATGQPLQTEVSADLCAGGDPPYHGIESRRDGTFDFWGMPPGSYCVSSEYKLGEVFSRAISQVTLTDRNIDGLVLALEPAIIVRGAAVVEGGSAEQLKTARIAVGESSSGAIPYDGKFDIPNVQRGTVRLAFERLPEGFYVKSIRQGPADLTATAKIEALPASAPLEIVFARGGAEISGSVTGAGTGLAPVAITLAPAGELAARVDLVRTEDAEDLNGAFRIQQIPPGRYLVFAWELKDAEMAAIPEFRALLEKRATEIELHAGEKIKIQPSLISTTDIEEARRRMR